MNNLPKNIGNNQEILDLIKERGMPIKLYGKKGKLYVYKGRQYVTFTGKAYLIFNIKTNFELDMEVL